MSSSVLFGVIRQSYRDLRFNKAQWKRKYLKIDIGNEITGNLTPHDTCAKALQIYYIESKGVGPEKLSKAEAVYYLPTNDSPFHLPS